MFQHESYDVSKMRGYFSTKFCSFVYKTTVHKFAALWCIYLTYAKLTEAQTSRTNFATVQRADFVINVIECPISPFLWCHCDVGIIVWFTLEKNDKFFNILSHKHGRLTDLVMGKISYETKMQMQTFHEISLRHWIIFTNFPEKGWKLSSVKAICLLFFIS